LKPQYKCTEYRETEHEEHEEEGKSDEKERDFQSCNHNIISNSKFAKLGHIPSQFPWLHFETEKRMEKK